MLACYCSPTASLFYVIPAVFSLENLNQGVLCKLLGGLNT